jgi:hypothetical protein
MSHLELPASGGIQGIRSMGDVVCDQISRGLSVCAQWRYCPSSMDELWRELKETDSHGANEM